MMSWSRFLLIAAAAFMADQATKTLALALLEPGWPVAVFPGFNLRLGFNAGASFGMLSETMAGRPLVMALLTGGLTMFLAWLGLKARAPLERAGFALIVGGATGNIVDRLRQGVVTDFLDFYWRDWHWPTFNGADIAIFLGAVSILLAAWKSRRDERTETPHG
jgi:signal peptidase II